MDIIKYPEGLSVPISFEEQTRELVEEVSPLHIDEAEFHHFPHSQGVFDISMGLADLYEETLDIKVNRRALGFAALGHDVLVHLDVDVPAITVNEILVRQAIPSDMVFESKEHRSAWIVRHLLVERGYDQTLTQDVYELIVSTKQGEACETPEKEILRMADIWNTQEFEQFEERAWAFYRENCNLGKTTCSFEEWLPGSMDFLEGFLDDRLPKAFTSNARNHILRLREKYQTATSIVAQ